VYHRATRSPDRGRAQHLVRSRPFGVVGRRHFVQDRRDVHDVEHARRIVAADAVRAERDVHPGIQELAERGDAGSELLVRDWVVCYRTTRRPHQRDVLVGDPDRMGDCRPLAERPNVVQMADERLAVELAPGDRLRFGLKNVDVIRRSVFRGEFVRAEKELIGATLRPGRRDDVPQPPLGVLETGQSLLREIEVVLRRRRHSFTM
jgi:hypothetical protein